MKIRAFREECPFFIVENRFLKRNKRFFEGEALTAAKAASPSNSPLATLKTCDSILIYLECILTCNCEGTEQLRK